MDRFHFTPEELDELTISERYGDPDERRRIMERRRRRRARLKRVLFFWRR
ncbi:MAG TPA: hypothetical protein VN238_03505 [Solirubrobacteraceae bacterium]|nr:hypothetical protein [Solirubrobacteraceae bacterium]